MGKSGNKTNCGNLKAHRGGEAKVTHCKSIVGYTEGRNEKHQIMDDRYQVAYPWDGGNNLNIML